MTIVDKIEVADPGFINFWLNKDTLLNNMIQIDSIKESYGKSITEKDMKVVVEYTDPNLFKEFHIGHLISNVTGESLARLQEAMGATIWRADYFGDVGLHVAKAVWGIERKMEEDKLSLDDLAKRSLNDSVELMGQGYALGVRSYEEDDSAKEEIERLNTVIYIVAQKLWQEKGKTAIVGSKERLILRAIHFVIA